MNKKLRTLDEHNNTYYYKRSYVRSPLLNGIACPECNSELYDSDPMKVLLTYPAKKAVHCDCCEYKGYRLT